MLTFSCSTAATCSFPPKQNGELCLSPNFPQVFFCALLIFLFSNSCRQRKWIESRLKKLRPKCYWTSWLRKLLSWSSKFRPSMIVCTQLCTRVHHFTICSRFVPEFKFLFLVNIKFWFYTLYLFLLWTSAACGASSRIPVPFMVLFLFSVVSYAHIFVFVKLYFGLLFGLWDFDQNGWESLAFRLVITTTGWVLSGNSRMSH